ncbi:MAG: LysE family transporter [Pseudomonadota bacterium]
MTLSALITLMGLQALIAMSPGPAGVMTIKTAASHGIRSGFALSFGLALAIVVWATAAMAGLKVVFDVAPFLQTSLRIVGAVFLIWIGISLFRHAKEPMPEVEAAQEERLLSLIQLGLWTNLANPKALAYFAAVFVGIMPQGAGLGWALLILAVIFAIEFAWYGLLTLIFSRPAPRRFYARAKAGLDRVFGGLIMALGARIALP